MEGGRGGGSRGGGGLMGFGENCHGFYPMIMMPPTAADSSNTLFLPSAVLQDLNRHGSLSGGGSSSMMLEEQNNNNSNINTSSNGYYFMESNNNDGGSCSVKAKIMAHPYYQRLLAAYVNCQKIGAPPEVVARLEEACDSAARIGQEGVSYVGEDPALDQFMEAYCEMLAKYEQELSKPFKDAMVFLSRIECQFKSLTISPSDSGDS